MSARPASLARTASPASLWLVLVMLCAALLPDWAMALRPGGVPGPALLCVAGVSPGQAWAVPAGDAGQADAGQVDAGDETAASMPRCSACLLAVLAGPPGVEPDDLPRPLAVTLVALRSDERPRLDSGPLRNAAAPRGPPGVA
ncbi:hypothetical protein [Sphaerotilus mobilis]|uniref:DUF2946 family protein n=1 Tax=Sphaerotilus mobilis TaxID=47994 RepID=A0A4Q7LKE5_9BURK|nr:hypothetical protein [Sphaerotilus mobilis]RZS54904.1 hypothetical protein EV685_2389 [Sphaerotilus mobilis]